MRGALLIATAAATLTAALPAHAATPAPDGHYSGATSQGFGIDLALAGGERVRRVKFAWRVPSCERARNGVQGTARLHGLRIADGAFAGRRTRTEAIPPSPAFGGGSQRVTYRVRGRFASRERARGRVRIAVVVRNRFGRAIDRCVADRAVRWSAHLLGAEPDAPDVQEPAAAG